MPRPPAPPDATLPAPRRQGNINFTGTSGRSYAFQAWPIDTRFKPVAAVYFVTKRAFLNRTYNTASHDAIYIGQTDNLANAFGAKVSLERFLKHEANCVCVHPLVDPELRDAIVRDLLGRHSTYCNDNEQGRHLAGVIDVHNPPQAKTPDTEPRT